MNAFISSCLGNMRSVMSVLLFWPKRCIKAVVYSKCCRKLQCEDIFLASFKWFPMEPYQFLKRFDALFDAMEFKRQNQNSSFCWCIAALCQAQAEVAASSSSEWLVASLFPSLPTKHCHPRLSYLGLGKNQSNCCWRFKAQNSYSGQPQLPLLLKLIWPGLQ